MKSPQTNLKEGLIPKLNLLCLIITALVFSIVPNGYAQESSANSENTGQTAYGIHNWDRFNLTFGGFFAAYNSGISVGLDELGAGISVDLEEALGLKTTGLVLRGEASYLFGKRRRHGLIGGYFDLTRTATKDLEQDLVIGGETYPIGSEVKSKLRFTIVRFKYAYNFVQDDRISIGFSAGFFIMPISYSIESLGIGSEKGDIIAPLPVIGLRLSARITPRIDFYFSNELLYLKTSGISGNILDTNFKAMHKTFKHFGFGLGINSTSIEVSNESETGFGGDFIGEVTSDYTGIMVFASFYF